MPWAISSITVPEFWLVIMGLLSLFEVSIGLAHERAEPSRRARARAQSASLQEWFLLPCPPGSGHSRASATPENRAGFHRARGVLRVDAAQTRERARAR